MSEVRVDESKHTWTFEQQKDVFLDGTFIGIVYWEHQPAPHCSPGWAVRQWGTTWVSSEYPKMDDAVAALVARHLE